VERLRPAGGATLCVTAEADPAVLRPQTAAEERLYSQLARGAEQARRGDADADDVMVRVVSQSTAGGAPDGISRDMHLLRCHRFDFWVSGADWTASDMLALRVLLLGVSHGADDHANDRRMTICSHVVTLMNESAPVKKFLEQTSACCLRAMRCRPHKPAPHKWKRSAHRQMALRPLL
jgi:hypothetical protein